MEFNRKRCRFERIRKMWQSIKNVARKKQEKKS
jgi:hypothetical protein